MDGVASDMVISPMASLPSVDRNGMLTGGSAGTDNAYGYVNGPLVEVREMVVRSDDDIRRISQELNTLMKAGRRARGLV